MHFWNANLAKITLAIVVSISVLFVMKLPYINILVPKTFFFLVIFLILILIFNIRPLMILFLVVILFVIAGMAETIGYKTLSDFLGEIIYYLFTYVTVALIVKEVKGRS